MTLPARARAALVASVAAALAGAGGARADGLSLTLEPGYGLVDSELRDAAGNRTREEVQTFRQRYRGSFDTPITEYLTTSLGGTFADDQGWKRANGVWSDAHDRQTTGFGRISLATPVLTLGLAAERREQALFSPSAPTVVTDSYTADALWRPAGLPELQLRAAHVDTYDRPVRDRDGTTDSAQLALRYRERQYELRYLLAWTRAEDRLHGVDTTGVEQSAIATRTDALFDGRLTSYLSGTVSARNGFTHARGLGGTVTRQQLPVAGLSAVVTLPAAPANVALQPNPALVDGNTGASAAVNLGWSLGALGDHDPREVGARFADVVTDVNTFYVWFDRRLTPEVGRAIAGAVQVWRSDDNVRWTALPVESSSVAQVENRIEVGIAKARSRYLKITLQPLAAGVTVDSGFRDLFVSEVQFLLVLPVDEVPNRDSNVSVSGTGIAKAILLSSPELTYDVSGTVTRQTSPGLTSYSLVNGLSIGRKLTRTLAASARGARQDVKDAQSHVGTWQWNAALVWNPLPTAFGTVTYFGSANDQKQTSHALSALGRADWYEGITTQASGTGSITTQGEMVTRNGQVTGTTSFAPNPYVTLSVGGLYSRTLVSDPTLGDTLTQYGRVDGTMSLYPAPALTASGSVSRVFLGERPTTFASVQGSFSPLRSELQLAVSYSKTLDTDSRSTTEQFAPSLRWNVRSGLSLIVAYTDLRVVSPAQTQATRALTANLLVVL